MIRVFVLEDDKKAMEIVKFLANNGCEVTHATTLDGTVYFLEDEPGLAAMDKLLFDLAVPGCKTEHWQGAFPPGEREYNGNYAGLEYIADCYKYWPEFREAVDERRVAILTAHARAMQEDFHQMLEENPGLDRVELIFKLSSTMDEQLLRFLRRK